VKQVQAKDFDISLAAAGGGFPDPDSFKSNIITDGTQNNTSYSNSKIDDIFKQGGKELDPAKRKALYDQAQQIISDDTPVFFLWNISSFSPFVKKIGGVVPNKGDQLYYNDAEARWYASAS
jgi:ABC-type transport system substrate-binding protein